MHMRNTVFYYWVKTRIFNADSAKWNVYHLDSSLITSLYHILPRYFAISISSIVPTTDALCTTPVVNLHGSFRLRKTGHLFCPASVIFEDSSCAQVPLIILYAPESTILKERKIKIKQNLVPRL